MWTQHFPSKILATISRDVGGFLAAAIYWLLFAFAT